MELKFNEEEFWLDIACPLLRRNCMNPELFQILETRLTREDGRAVDSNIPNGSNPTIKP